MQEKLESLTHEHRHNLYIEARKEAAAEREIYIQNAKEKEREKVRDAEGEIDREMGRHRETDRDGELVSNTAPSAGYFDKSTERQKQNSRQQ